MADPTYQPKVYRKQGGDEQIIASGGKITVESGGVVDTSAATGGLKVAAGEIAAPDLATNAVEEAKINALAVTLAKIALGILEGSVVANVADVNVIGGLPLLHRIVIADAASSNVEVTLTHKTRIIDVWVVKTVADGNATEDKIKVGNAANDITDDMTIGLPNDKGITRAATIDDAFHEIAATGKLRVTWTKGGGGSNNVDCIVYVLGIRVA